MSDKKLSGLSDRRLEIEVIKACSDRALLKAYGAMAFDEAEATSNRLMGTAGVWWYGVKILGLIQFLRAVEWRSLLRPNNEQR